MSIFAILLILIVLIINYFVSIIFLTMNLGGPKSNPVQNGKEGYR